VLLPIEGVWQPKVRRPPGTHRFGAWSDTSRADDVVLDRHGGVAATSGPDPLSATWHAAVAEDVVIR